MKLKPIIYTTNRYARGAEQRTQQIILLKALQVTQDPNKLREMTGIATVAGVYRTLDKMAMRKEFHDALLRAGISFDYVVDGIKGIADNAEKDDTRLKALQTILKSLGMDKYDVTEADGGGTWEEELLKLNEKRNATKALPAPSADYDVKTPVIPDEVKKMRQDEDKVTGGIYE